MTRVPPSDIEKGVRPQNRHRHRGFTLLELIVVIIVLGILAAIAVPRYVAMDTGARIAAIKTLASTLRSTTENVHVLCKLDPTCDYSAQIQTIAVGGTPVTLCYGWICSGYVLRADLIDGWVTTSGFTASVFNTDTTLFTLDNSPNPPSCSVGYQNPFYAGPAGLAIISTNVAGC